MQDTTTIILPIPPDTLGIFAFTALLFLGSYIIFVMLPNEPGKPHKGPMQRMEESFGIKLESRVTAALLVVALFAYIMIFFFALNIAVRALGGILFLSLPDVMAPTQPRVSLAFGTLLAAILGAPFIIWRTVIAGKQIAIAEESLFNDKINAAATDLAARRQVTRVIKDKNEIETILTEWEDDLVTRAAAIDRLEGLALERPDVAPRVARMLSIYVQELSRAHPAQNPPENASPQDLREWAATLTPIRPDMERAVQSLGRINPTDEDARTAFNPKNIDLRRCNLQGFDLTTLNFQGADLGEAQMQGVGLFRAKMQGADLGWAQMQGANLRGAQMQGADLSGAQMQGADLSGAQMQGANLRGAQMQGANLRGAQMQGAYLRGAQMQGANLRGAQMQGAYLSGAQMQGAYLSRAEMDTSTNLTGASLWGVAVRFVDNTTLTHLQAHGDWDQMFYAGDTNDFLTQWRAFAAALDPPVTITPDYEP